MDQLTPKRWYGYMQSGKMIVLEDKPEDFQELPLRKELTAPNSQIANRVYEIYVESVKFNGR